MIPRPHQRAAVEDALTKFELTDRVQLRMACGTGKTYIAALLKQRLNADLTVFFVPTIYLAHQSYSAWREQISDLGRALIVCSKGGTTLNDEWLDEMASTATVSTSEQAIRNCLQGSQPLTVFCTYKSAPKLVGILNDLNVTVDFAVCDEAHNIAGRRDKQAQCVLNELQSTKTAFLTATPRLSVSDDAIGMDDPEFGEVAYNLSFKSAVDLGILCPYKIQFALVKRSDGTRTTAENDYAAIKALKRAASAGFKRGLTFHNTIAAATRFRALLAKKIPSIAAHSLSYRDSISERDEVIAAVKASGGVITNVSILGEGFDFPELDHIVIVEPKSSVVDISQNIGRIMRKCDGKSEVRAIVPIVLDDDHELAHEKVRVVNVIEALAVHDETLASIIANQRYRLGSRENLVDLLREVITVVRVDEDLPEDLVPAVHHRLVDLFFGNRLDHVARLQDFKTFVEQYKRLPASGLRRSEREMNLNRWMYLFPTKKPLDNRARQLHTEIQRELTATQERYSLIGYSELAQKCRLPQTYVQKRYGKWKANFLRRLKAEFGVEPVSSVSRRSKDDSLWFNRMDAQSVIDYFLKERNKVLARYVPLRSIAGRDRPVSTSYAHRAIKSLGIEVQEFDWFGMDTKGERPRFVSHAEAKKIQDLAKTFAADRKTRNCGLRQRNALIAKLIEKGYRPKDIAKRAGIAVSGVYSRMKNAEAA
jgi:superfamily II DNA or RNA helicase